MVFASTRGTKLRGGLRGPVYVSRSSRRPAEERPFSRRSEARSSRRSRRGCGVVPRAREQAVIIQAEGEGILRRLSVVLAAVLLVAPGIKAQAPAQQAAGEPKTVLVFYTVKWGSQDEFLDLFQRNHYPILKEMEKAGLYLSVKTYVPENRRRRPGGLDVRRRARSARHATVIADRSGDRGEAVSRPRQAAEGRGAPLRAARRALGRATEPD